MAPYVLQDPTAQIPNEKVEEFKTNGELEINAPKNTPNDLVKTKTITYLIIDETKLTPEAIERLHTMNGKMKAKVSTYIPLSAYFSVSDEPVDRHTKLRVELQENDELRQIEEDLKSALKKITVQFRPAE